MGIIRGRLEHEGHFTQLPNTWLRDKTLSLKARGLLVEMMSHQVGWSLTLESLKSEKDGTGSVKSAVAELQEAGWLTIERPRGENGRLGPSDYVLKEPPRSVPQVDFPPVVIPPVDNPGTKNTIPLEHHLEEQSPPESEPEDERFAEWWKAYPRKESKGDAKKAFTSALRRIDFAALMSATRLYAEERSKIPAKDKKFTPYPASWLNKERYLDVGSSGVQAEIEELVAAEDVMGLQSLTGVRCPLPDFGDVSPAEQSRLSLDFWRDWVSEQKDALVAAAGEKNQYG